MTKAKLVFDPFSQDFFNGAYETYRRMRDEAPVYYNERARLLRADPARRRGAPRSRTSRRTRRAFGCRPFVGRVRVPTSHRHEVDHLHGPAGAPPHAQPAQQGVHPAGHPGAAARRSSNSVEHYLQRRSRTTSTSCRTSPAPFPVEVITRWPGVPEDSASRFGTGSTRACIARPARSRSDETGHAGQHRQRDVLPTDWSRSAGRDPQDDMFSQPDRSRSPSERTADCDKLDDIEITAFASPARRRGRRDGHQAGRQVRCTCSPRTPTSGRSCWTTAARSRPPSRSCCATSARCSTTSADSMKDVELQRHRSRRANRSS